MGRINGTRGAKIKWAKIKGSEILREAKFEKNKEVKLKGCDFLFVMVNTMSF